MTDSALIVFMKNPVAGKVKTRLAASLGNEKALRIYLDLIAYTQRVVYGVNADIWLFYSDFIPENDAWNDVVKQKRIQTGSDLGSRMLNAFQEVYDAHYKRAAIIGTDCPELTTELINQAFDHLTQHQLVVGPAKDGGYYLLGSDRLYTSLFQNKPWGTSRVKELTIQDAKEQALRYTLLPELCDVDTEADLQLTGFFKTLSFKL